MRSPAHAKINLGLVVGPLRPDGKHEIATVLVPIELHDDVELEWGTRAGVVVDGFARDTLVRRSLELFDRAAGSETRWRVTIEKRIPVAAGLGGGSSDAAAALVLANDLSGNPLSPAKLHELAAAIGSDVPFFLWPGSKVATGNGTILEPVELPDEYSIVLALPRDAQKTSTGDVYAAVDEDAAARDFHERRARLVEAVQRATQPRDLAALPHNELAAAPDSALAGELASLGAFRVDTSGAGPAVYGLFEEDDAARRARSALEKSAATWLARPVGPDDPRR